MLVIVGSGSQTSKFPSEYSGNEVVQPHGLNRPIHIFRTYQVMNAQTAAGSPTPKRRRVRILRILGVLSFLLVAVIAAAPWIIAHTVLRDRTINAILASPSVTASSESASFGWFSPLSVQGLNLQSSNKRVDVHVGDIAAQPENRALRFRYREL